MVRNTRRPARRRAPRRTRRRQPRRRNVRNGRRLTTSRTSLTGTIVRGVRNLVTLLPGGKALTGIADLALKALGVANLVRVANGVAIADGANIYSMTGLTRLFYRNIVGRTPVVARDTTLGGFSKFQTSFREARLMSVKIIIQNDTARSSRSGRWTAVFIPFRTAKDSELYDHSQPPTTFDLVSTMPGSITANADCPLVLTFRPTPADGLCYQYQAIKDTAFGALILAYADELRDSYTAFTASEISPNIIVSGQVQLRQPVTASSESIEDSTDKPKPIKGILIGDGTNTYHFTNYEHDVENSRITEILSLDDMTI